MIYQDLYNIVIPTLANKCINVSNYYGLPAEFRSGYWWRWQNNKCAVDWSIINPIPQISTDQFNNDCLWLFRDHWKIDLTKTVTKQGVLNFYGKVACMCAARIATASSQRNWDKYTVYLRDRGVQEFVTFNEGDLAAATDTKSITENISNIVAANTRGYMVRYNHSIVAL